MKTVVKERTPRFGKAVERLFGEKGACGGCWCMWWRIEKGEEWKNVKGSEAKNRLRTMIENGTVRGLMAYDGSEPIGWCTFWERNDLSLLNRARTFKVEGADKILCVTCL